jgi:orotate phosphoribosyltransferase
MSKTEFIAICSEYFIDAALALESDQVIQAIKEGSIEKLKEVLENDF